MVYDENDPENWGKPRGFWGNAGAMLGNVYNRGMDAIDDLRYPPPPRKKWNYFADQRRLAQQAAQQGPPDVNAQPYAPPPGYGPQPGPDDPAYHSLGQSYLSLGKMQQTNAALAARPIPAPPVAKPYDAGQVAADYLRQRPYSSPGYHSAMSPEQIRYATQGTTNAADAQAQSAAQSYQAHTDAMYGRAGYQGMSMAADGGGGMPRSYLSPPMGNLDQRFGIPSKPVATSGPSFAEWAQTHPTGDTTNTARNNASYQRYLTANPEQQNRLRELTANQPQQADPEVRRAMATARAQRIAAQRGRGVPMTEAMAHYQTALPEDYPSYAAAFGVPRSFGPQGWSVTPYPQPPRGVQWQPAQPFDDTDEGYQAAMPRRTFG